MSNGIIKKPDNNLPIDIYFDKYSICYQTTAGKVTTGILISLILFSLLGMAWAIPFPYLKILGKYNGFFNWASFFIAFSVYGYYKLSPVLSYFIFFILFAFSYGIMQLDLWHKSGGPALWLICIVIFIVSFTVQLATFRTANKRFSVIDSIQFILIAPLWLLHFIIKRFAVRY